MREFTIEITTYCPYECDYCSTNASIIGKPLPFDEIVKFLDKHNILSEDRINISGGEPLAHPEFWNILQLCKSKTSDVWVYTNALKNIRYNSSVVHEINCEANVCITPGKSVYIPKKARMVHLLQLVSRGRARNMYPVNIHVSGNIHSDEKCKKCNHMVLQADGKMADSPCRKNYD
jgi:molybdenum cofactor biosynthesis enzyme MoaA